MKHVVLAVLLVLLVGCGGDPQPRFSSAPPTPAPTSAAPAVETPQAFLRRWYRVSDQMELTGKTRAFDALHAKSCGDCETYASAIRGIYASKNHVVGSRTNVIAMQRLGPAVWRVDTKSAPMSVRDRRGRVVGRYPGGLSTYRVGLAHGSAGWRVTSYVRLAASR